MRTTNKLKKYEVTWLDHFGSVDKWTRPEDMDGKPFTVITMGFLVRETKELIYMANGQVQENEPRYHEIMGIVKSAIVKKRIIK